MDWLKVRDGFYRTSFLLSLMFSFFLFIDERSLPSKRKYYYYIDIDNLPNLHTAGAFSMNYTSTRFVEVWD